MPAGADPPVRSGGSVGVGLTGRTDSRQTAGFRGTVSVEGALSVLTHGSRTTVAAIEQALPIGEDPPPPQRHFSRWRRWASPPFFLFALMFLIVPTTMLMVGAFQDKAEPALRCSNIVDLAQPPAPSRLLLDQHQDQRRLAVGGAISGCLFIAQPWCRGCRRPRLRPAAMILLGRRLAVRRACRSPSPSVATLGRARPRDVAAARRRWASTSIAAGFNLLSPWGLTPHVSLFPDPADDADHRAASTGPEAEWSEACASTLGASSFHYWRYVGAAGAVAEHHRRAAAPVRQRLRRRGNRLCAHRLLAQHRHHPCSLPRSAATC